MAKTFKTAQSLINAGFNQTSGETLTLNGNTLIGNSATFKYATDQHNNYTPRSVVDAAYVTGKTSCIANVGSDQQIIYRDVFGITGATHLIYNKSLPSLMFGCNNCALSINSAIIGGNNNYISSGNTDSTIFGGNGIVLSAATYCNTVVVPNLAIWNTPEGSGNILGWDSISKKVCLTTGNTSGGNWGSITGVLSGQTDLQNALNAKLNITDFDTYTGTTAPNTYVSKTEFSSFSGATYNLTSPSIFATGGMCAGTILTGKTTFEILKEILAPELCGTLTTPSVSISLSPATTLYEIGCSISALCVTGTFNQGCINPQYCSTSPKRSGAVNCYKFAGCQIAGSYTCTTSPVTKSATGYTICASQTWQVCTCYDAGVQPKGNAGSNFSSPLSAGVVCSPICTITGIYPYYYGKLTSGSRPAVTNSIVSGGTKCVLNAGTCTSVVFGAVGEWTWFAIPAACAARAYWCETALSRGTMATGITDKYPDTCTLNITSGQGCWSTISYNVYMSGTVGTIGTIALSNYLI